MYVNPIIRWKDEPEIISFIQKDAFATLSSQGNGIPPATHLLLVLKGNESGKSIISDCIYKANFQWKAIPEQGEILVIFQGPHTYISSLV